MVSLLEIFCHPVKSSPPPPPPQKKPTHLHRFSSLLDFCRKHLVPLLVDLLLASTQTHLTLQQNAGNFLSSLHCGEAGLTLYHLVVDTSLTEERFMSIFGSCINFLL